MTKEDANETLVQTGTRGVEITAAQAHRRRRWRRAWFAVAIAWGLLRTLVVWQALSDYGVNPWIYAVIDLSASVIDGLVVPRIVTTWVDGHHRLAMRWGMLLFLTFISPEFYIMISGNKMPKSVYVAVAILILVFAVVGIYGLILKVRKAREERLRFELLGVEPEPIVGLPL